VYLPIASVPGQAVHPSQHFAPPAPRGRRPRSQPRPPAPAARPSRTQAPPACQFGDPERERGWLVLRRDAVLVDVAVEVFEAGHRVSVAPSRQRAHRSSASPAWFNPRRWTSAAGPRRPLSAADPKAGGSTKGGLAYFGVVIDRLRDLFHWTAAPDYGLELADIAPQRLPEPCGHRPRRVRYVLSRQR
jgi:hypothetical protein